MMLCDTMSRKESTALARNARLPDTKLMYTLTTSRKKFTIRLHLAAK
jgi:hypothetical protein